jgi:hypothetical protein
MKNAYKPLQRRVSYYPYVGAAVAVITLLMLTASAARAGFDNSQPTFDLTTVLVTVVGGIFSTLGIILTAIINKYVKDAQAREVLRNAVTNGLGILQQAAQGEVKKLDPELHLPGQLAQYAPAVQYVFDHAGDEAARFGLTPETIAEKIEAQIGLANVAHNLAVSASPAAETPRPLSPVNGA